MLGGEHVRGQALLDRGHRAPAHAEVALDGAGDRDGGDHLPREAGVLGVQLDHGVHVGRRAADVDHHHVTGTGVLLVEAVREQLDRGEHHVGGGAADHRGEVGPLRQVLAADHVAQEHLADRGACGVRGEHPDLRHHVGREHVRRPRPVEQRGHLGLGLDVPGHHDRARPGRLGQGPGTGQQHLGVAAVGPADQQDHVGAAAGELLQRRRGESATGDVHHPAAARQRDPAPRLRGDQLLVAHHADPQAPARGRAGEHPRPPRLRLHRAQLLETGVPAVEHVGVDRRPVARGRDQLPGPHLDQRRLRERRPEVDAGDQHGDASAGGSTGGAPAGGAAVVGPGGRPSAARPDGRQAARRPAAGRPTGGAPAGGAAVVTPGPGPGRRSGPRPSRCRR